MIHDVRRSVARLAAVSGHVEIGPREELGNRYILRRVQCARSSFGTAVHVAHYAQRRTCRRYCSYLSSNTSLSFRSSTGITTQFRYATTSGKSTNGHACRRMPASPTYATLRPTYIGLRVK